MARYCYADAPDGSSCFRIDHTALPCPGVALRLNTVIDCTPGEGPMPPLTIDFLKPGDAEPVAAAAHQGGGEAQQQQLAGRFTCDSGDFVLFPQLQRVEAMVAAAGLPPECAPSVTEFCHLSVSNAANTFYKAVAITVEAGAPARIVAEQYDHEDEDEDLPAGAVVGECAICYKMYLVGGATSVRLPCTHVFHRRCLDRWTCVRRTCPYCRAPVPLPEEEDGQEDVDEQQEDYYGREDDDVVAAAGETRGLDVSGSRPTSTRTRRICVTATLPLIMLGCIFARLTYGLA